MSDDMFVTDAPREIIDALGGERPTIQQWEAISAPLEPCALIAGAGSGKTAVMAARMVWLITNGHAAANEILGLTFTNKAAASLRERVRAAIAPLGLPEGEEPEIATYHSFASSLIADYGIRAGVEPGSALMTPAQAWQLAKEQLMHGRFDALEPRSDYYVGWVQGLADDCANHLVEPKQIIEWDTGFLEKVDASADRISRKVVDASKKRIELAAIVADYIEAKRSRNVIDYGDQIRMAYEIVQDPVVGEDFRARFRFALLDEYQDTNVAQARMLQALMPPGYPVMAVGDPDQNIYAWRGASLRNLLHFAQDFPNADGTPATERKLEVNFRSGNRILAMANILIQGVPEERRPPDKTLRAYPPLGTGTLAAGLYPDQLSEADAIVAEAIRAHDAGTPWSEMAVLSRKRRLFEGLAAAFRAADVPVEVIGMGGLLSAPEIVDLVSLLRILEDPMSNVAVARLLQGPRWRIGHRDLALLAGHMSEQNRELREQLADIDEFPVDVAISLAEAVGAADEVPGLSDEARARLGRFNTWLAALRAKSQLGLPALVGEAVDALGILREVDASPRAGADSARRNIANFMDRVASFTPLDGEPTLGTFVEWLDAVGSSEEDIEAAQPTDADAVKIMTIHQAKGLEFDLVFLPGLARANRSQIFPDTSRQANPATQPQHMPFELRGDAAVLPRFTGVLTHFAEALTQRAEEEERRLFYVAVTRARKRLVVSAAHWYLPSGMDEALKNPMGPSEYWGEVRAFPDLDVLAEIDQPEENPLIDRRAVRAVNWPRPARRAPAPGSGEGLRETVMKARAAKPQDESLFPVEPTAEPLLPATLPVTSLVTFQMCPKNFYWSVVRPLPRRPSAAARIGTIVHNLIERSTSKQIALIDPEEYADRPPSETDGKVAELASRFKSSRFSGRDPLDTERPFALVLGDVVVQGRIDAIYSDGDAWEIVDWKTGRAPAGDRAHLDLQLDIYALAAQEIWGKRVEDLSLLFVYLGGDEPVERAVQARPADAIRTDLEALLGRVKTGEYVPEPSSMCTYCDFKRDCAEGRAFLADEG